jgi:4-aminobutyrate aminotransferase-like enzyme/Ser/Thr protein kinase RdoA (MazF antagonist)
VLIHAAATAKPSPLDAAEIARSHFGIEGRTVPLPGEFDHNFLIESAGSRAVLKIMREGCERAFIEMQIAALERTGGSAIGGIVTLGDGRLAWMLPWRSGKMLSEAKPRTLEMLRELGALLARTDLALKGFEHPLLHRELKWDLTRAEWIRDYIHHIPAGRRRTMVERALRPIPDLPRAVIHGDANDHNVLVDRGHVIGLIDFGDLHESVRVGEPAIAATYASFGMERPLDAIAAVAAGYHAVSPLSETEIAALVPLVELRLAVSVTNSAYLKTLSSDPYTSVSETQAWEVLEKLAAMPAGLGHCIVRHACKLEPVPQSLRVGHWLIANAASFAPVIEGIDLRTEECVVFDLSVGSQMLGADPAAIEEPRLTPMLFSEMKRAGVRVGVGQYDEARGLYLTDAFATGSHPTDERRTVHIGLDLFAEIGTGICAPLAGVVHSFANHARKCDYGPVIILQHAMEDGTAFYTLYGHLTVESLDGLYAGKPIARGERFCAIGAPPANGDWTPHLHFQIITDLMGYSGDFPGVALASQREVWKSISPDPSLIVRLEIPDPCERNNVRVFRETFVGPSLSLSYSDPLMIVRGWRQYLYDETGRAFLDCYNNVPLVGHSHPRVVQAVQRQIALLNTNTRYLHQNLVDYASLLSSRSLEVCYILNSASEANELAIRMARTYTGREDVIVLEHAYHGHTNTLIDISPYKFDGPGGRGRKPWVHVAPIPDDYRGPYKRDDPDRGKKYAAHVGEICELSKPACFIAESLPSVGGQVVLPPGYLKEAYAHVRAAGGVCIADEVQVGFGRLGRWMWGYEMQEVQPDIVVLGKPIGNGFPLAAVITTRDIAKAFDNGMEFFSTFGGNPVACAAGLATSEVLHEERLPQNAERVGDYWIAKLRALMDRHPIIGDVRGAGLFLGIELVRNRETLEPAGEEASYVVNRLCERGILTGTDGPHHNVIKLRPPLIFTEQDAEFFTATLDEILGEDPVTERLY